MAASNVKKSTSRKKFSFTGCSKMKYNYPDLHFFQFPVKRSFICEQWITNCANSSLSEITEKTLQGRVVCADYFTDDCFFSSLKNIIKKNAIPTIFLTDNEPIGDQPMPSTPNTINVDQPTTSTYSPSSRPTGCRKTLFSPETPILKKFKSVKNKKQTPGKIITPAKKKLMETLKKSQTIRKRYQQTVKRLSIQKRHISKLHVINYISELLPEKVANFFTMQIHHVGKPKKQWSSEEKTQVMTMRFKSPALYDQMRSDGFALPCPSTIARWLQAIDLQPGVCHEVLQLFKTKIDCMSMWEKKAVVMIDEMAIKKNFDYDTKGDLIEGVRDLGELDREPSPGSGVLLVMARGLIHKWKMPVAYYIVNSTVKSNIISDIISNCVSALQNIGLDVKALVCDQGSTNRKAVGLLNVTKEKPYFMSEGKRIYVIYDFPHIMKCVRINMMKQTKKGGFVGLITTNRVADWRHIVALYELDRSSCTARATKLTDKHIRPNAFEKMTVKLATQVMSHSVSTAMQSAIDCKQLPNTAEQTVRFLSDMNNLFNPNPYRCAISCSQNDHLSTPLKTIQEGLEWSKTWTIKGSTKCPRPPSFDGLQHSLTATVMLWEDVNNEGVSYLLTGRLNQDPLENEFSIARQKCGYNRNPSAKLLRLNLRHRIQTSLLTPPSGANCEPDEDDILPVTVQSPASSKSTGISCKDDVETICTDESETTDDDDLIEGIKDDSLSQDTELSLETCAVRYFAGYAIRACIKKFRCEDCKSSLLKTSDETLADESLIRNRQYTDSDTGLLYPTDETVAVMKTALDVFDRLFLKNIHIKGLRKKMLFQTMKIVELRYPNWIDTTPTCYDHRKFSLNKLFTAKIFRKTVEMSKDLRQPYKAKFTNTFNKLKNLNNQ